MTDKSYKIWADKSDKAIEKDLGLCIKEWRQRLQKTQAELASEADISRSTLSLMERGEAGTITTLIKILRVLDQLQVMNVFDVHQPISPLALAKMQAKSKQRIKKSKSNTTQKSDW